MADRKVRDSDITLTTAVASATTLDMRDMAAAVVAFGTVDGSSSTLQLWASNASAVTPTPVPAHPIGRARRDEVQAAAMCSWSRSASTTGTAWAG